MYRKNLRRVSAIILSFIMIFSGYSVIHADYNEVSPEYVGINPLATVLIEMETSADDTLEIREGDVLNVTVRWMRFFSAASEPIAVWTTNGATVDPSSMSVIVQHVKEDDPDAFTAQPFMMSEPLYQIYELPYDIDIDWLKSIMSGE